MNQNNVYYMQLAYKKAQIAFLNNNVPVGCVITNKKNTLISSNNTNSKNKLVFEHAEINGLLKLVDMSENFNNYYIYTTLIPCPMCAGAIYINGIKKHFYGTKNNDNKLNEYYFSLFSKNNSFSYLSDRCSKILSLFFIVRR